VGNEVYETKSLIVAAGASARLLGLKGEKELIGRGLSTCATCDGYFFRGKPIAVVGGGDSAMEEANFLSRYASKLYLIHRRNEFRASKIMIDRAKANGKIEFVTPYVVDEILSPEGLVNGVLLHQSQTGQKRKSRWMACSWPSAMIPIRWPSAASWRWTRTVPDRGVTAA